jgi:hypothetical protein
MRTHGTWRSLGLCRIVSMSVVGSRGLGAVLEGGGSWDLEKQGGGNGREASGPSARVCAFMA